MAAAFRFPRPGEPVDPAYIALLERIERESILLDSRYRIPGTQVRFGLDSIIGIFDDIVSAAWSMRLLAYARQIVVRPPLLHKMMLIIAADFFVGLITLRVPSRKCSTVPTCATWRDCWRR